MPENEKDYINFGDYVRKELGIQCQYASHYVSGVGGSPVLSTGLRILGNPGDYHSLRIHKDDAPVFVVRVREWKRKLNE